MIFLKIENFACVNSTLVQKKIHVCIFYFLKIALQAAITRPSTQLLYRPNSNIYLDFHNLKLA